MARPTYHKKEGATPHPGVYKHGFKHDGRPDGRLGVQIWMWNLGSLGGKGAEACEEQRKSIIDVCC